MAAEMPKSECKSGAREQQDFEERLPNDAAVGRASRYSDGVIAAPGEAAREQKARHVGATDRE